MLAVLTTASLGGTKMKRTGLGRSISFLFRKKLFASLSENFIFNSRHVRSRNVRRTKGGRILISEN